MNRMDSLRRKEMSHDFQSVCDKDMCAGCMLCMDICPVCAITVKDNMEAYNAVIDVRRCIKCGKCHKLCPQNVQPDFKKPLEWYQGWSRDEAIRAGSASGGMATEIASRFIQNGGEVCTCIFENGNFMFRFFDKMNELPSAAGSKYVKSNPHGIYKELSNKLASGKKVLMIGLPCQISAAKKFINSSYDKNFYTIDLVCHGTPSPDLLSLFLMGKHVAVKDIKAICFREKNNTISEYHPLEKNVLQEKIKDEYMYGYDRGMFYTKNCYYCPYARFERISDITLGDSWGSELSAAEKNKGISLLLCQTTNGKELMRMSEAELLPVDIENAINNNMNLKKPSNRPDSGNRFFSEIKKGKSFHMAMLCAEPKWVIKHTIKKHFPWAVRIKQKLGGGISATIQFGIKYL